MLTTYRYDRKPGVPRPAYTYRAARRNVFLRAEPKSTWPGVKAGDGGFIGKVRLNRSRHSARLVNSYR